MIPSETRKRIAVLLIFTIGVDILTPPAALALTGGPTQPEFSSFEPVATTNMVNEFTGDFTYNLPVLNIPGANGGGYALSLAYHSGTTPEEEASWVGYGWTLNPGAIIRNKRGFPDDWNGHDVKYWNKAPSNKTVTIGGGIGAEFFSIDGNVGLNGSIRYNNYKGFGYAAGISTGLPYTKGVVSLGYNITDGEGSFSLAINPAAALNYLKEEARESDSKEEARAREANNKSIADLQKLFKGSRVSLLGSNYGIFTYSGVQRPTQITPYEGKSYTLSLGLLATPGPAPIGITGNLFGSYSFLTNLPEDDLKAYGYMYSSQAGDNDMMDYHVEKGTTYNKRDKFLGIPFNNADNFNVSGEGIGGGFRMYNKKAGHFHPNHKKSTTDYFTLGFEVEAGLDFGGGADIGAGQQTLEVSAWENLSAFADETDTLEDEANFFRFNNDLGGFALFDAESLQKADIRGGGTPGFKSFDASVDHIAKTLNEGERSGRSSYIGYSTNEQMTREVGNVKYSAYTKDTNLNSFIDRTEAAIADQLGEISVINEDGQQYTYGLPVYSRNEKNLHVDLSGVPGTDIDNNYLAYRNITSGEIDTRIGEERDAPYASMYLLTSITDADYIDRTNDGPSTDDFGGYTRFVYTQAYGSQQKAAGGNWYQWRIPYNGLLYNRNELSNPKDDLGSVMEGEKEIYYLDSIITKTHVAIFNTSPRLDGREAHEDPVTASADRNAMGNDQLQKLDNIQLYARHGNQLQLIETVHFQYDYSLAQGVSNSDDGNGNKTGKLTLKKVWLEFDGIVNARISPYQFEYQYPTVNYPARYSHLENYGAGMEENPGYSSFALDAWGNYQAEGAERFRNMQSWLHQAPPSSFDPAAWQLKGIKLPSGGEIHVQYEQDDYVYVQDKRAHALVSLRDNPNDASGSGNRFYLNLNDLGIQQTGNFFSNPEVRRLRSLIEALYVGKNERMYFKYLYKLIGSDQPQLTDCNAEYITGYAHVQQVGIDNAEGLWVELGGGDNDYDLPHHVCQDLVKTQKAGMLSLSGDCNAAESGIASGNSSVSIIENFLGWAASFSPIPATCLRLNYNLSYLRIPIIEAKKGGGIRVKRLLMYDQGLETGYPELYGNEYNYQTYDEQQGVFISSGVATNEPATIREENILVGFLERFEQGFLDKIIAGRDKKQSEGPIGESVMPGPSVGYSQVIVKNIHTGKTSPGYTVNAFFTARDYPFIYAMTEIETEKDYLPLPLGVINKFTNNVWLSQGFVFKTNQMHGQLRSVKTYAGAYDPTHPDENASALMVSVEHTYFEPEEQIPVMKAADQIAYSPLGREMDVTFESRAVKDINNDGTVEIDIDVGIAGIIPIPYVSGFPYLTFTEAELYTHATSKVISYPAVVKRTVAYQEGIYHTTENVAFDPHTGQPLITKTHDGFFEGTDLLASADPQGIYTSYTFPASSVYGNMGQVATGEKKYFRNGAGIGIEKQFTNNRHLLEFKGDGSSNLCEAMKSFMPGDLVRLSTGELFHIGEIKEGFTLELLPVSYGGAYNANPMPVDVEIIRSGRTNQLNAVAGAFTTYGPDAAQTLSQETVNAPAIIPRQALVARLNQILAQGGVGTVDLSNEIPDLSLYIGDCGGPKGLSIDLDFSDPAVGIITFHEERDDCSEELTKSGGIGRFVVEPHQGALVYEMEDSQCNGIVQSLQCPVFCEDTYIKTIVKNVVSSEAATFHDHWPYAQALYYPLAPAQANAYEKGEKGQWRLQSDYAYNTGITGLKTAYTPGDPARNYNSGTYDLELFNWVALSNNSPEKWLRLNTVTQYSPQGLALEEENLLGIKSAAKFGYHSTVPYLIAQNAAYASVVFESFENTYQSGANFFFEDGIVNAPNEGDVDATTAHSGKQSLKLKEGNSGMHLNKLSVTDRLPYDGLLLKVWVKTDLDNLSGIEDSLLTEIREPGQYVRMARKFRQVAQVGEWMLYECKIPDLGALQIFTDYDIYLKYNFTDAHENIWIDDVRLQPLEAQMTAYVYDVNTLRLLTSFDDQHFGLYYQYNAEGKLVRKIIETERGIKTIEETQYNIPLVAR